MARNVEIKARVRDFAAAQALAESLSNAPEVLLEQQDTFYRVAKGRLKLRDSRPGGAELIYYERGDRAEARLSEYSRAGIADAALLNRLLSAALGVCGLVRKQRRLFQVGQTRIHLDRVEGLGEFLELKYVLREGEEESAGQIVVAELSRRLGILQEDMIACSYADLLAANAARG
jgi:predicted adenylyl cyclase CyaB